MLKKSFIATFVLFCSSLALLFAFNQITKSKFITFSDAAKIAEVGRNLAVGKGFGSKFILFINDPSLNDRGLFSAWVISPLMPLLDALSFKTFGVGDSRVVAVSSFFYLLLVVFVFLLSKKLFGTLTGTIAAIAVGSNQSMLAYAGSGASETLFTAEIIIAIFLFSQKKLWTDILGFVTLFLLLLTRAHAPLYVVPIVFYFIQLKTENIKKTVKIFSLITLAGLIIIGISLIIPGLSFGKLLTERILVSLAHNSSFAPANDVLRMNQNTLSGLISANLFPLVKKLFYNLYNFYKLIPNIYSPYLFGLFVIGLFKWKANKDEDALKMTTITTVIIVFVVNALTVPLYRYLHPLIPLIYIFAADTMVWIVKKVSGGRLLNTALVSIFLVFVFGVGQTLGVIFLDSRFEAKRVNRGKPPVYVTLAKILKENTNSDQTVVTNLDTWGSWYGERRTIWYPLRPDQLSQEDSKKVTYDAIYLTSYLIDDENYYMGPEWRQIFENPKSPGDKFIAKNYRFVGEFKVSADETYEKQSAKAVLLVRKTD